MLPLEGLDTKFCPGCGETKAVAAFALDRQAKSGYQGRCKACCAARRRSAPACSQAGCDKPSEAHGICAMHNKRVRRHGALSATPRLTRDPVVRFWRYVDKSGECWTWQGKRRYGYGVFTFGRRSLGQRLSVRAHRYAYEIMVGPIPPGLTLDHLCRTRECVNPAHLEPVTSAENTRRAGAAVTHCRYGHQYTVENTYRIPKTGRRSCRACRDRRNREFALRVAHSRALSTSGAAS